MSFSGAASFLKKQSALEQLLEEINFQRTKEMRQLLKDDSGFVVLHGSSYWTDLFVRHFLFQAEHCIDGDDLLFFVKKKHIKGTSRYLPKYETEVDVYRKDSRKLPIGDPDMDWEETVYLNLIIHQFDYTLTLAICTRTSPKQLQVLRRHSQDNSIMEANEDSRQNSINSPKRNTDEETDDDTYKMNKKDERSDELRRLRNYPAVNEHEIIEDIPIEESLMSQQQTLMWNDEMYLRIALGENNVPISILFEEHVEELSFPQIYYGPLEWDGEKIDSGLKATNVKNIDFQAFSSQLSRSPFLSTNQQNQILRDVQQHQQHRFQFPSSLSSASAGAPHQHQSSPVVFAQPPARAHNHHFINNNNNNQFQAAAPSPPASSTPKLFNGQQQFSTGSQQPRPSPIQQHFYNTPSVFRQQQSQQQQPPNYIVQTTGPEQQIDYNAQIENTKNYVLNQQVNTKPFIAPQRQNVDSNYNTRTLVAHSQERPLKNFIHPQTDQSTLNNYIPQSAEHKDLHNFVIRANSGGQNTINEAGLNVGQQVELYQSIIQNTLNNKNQPPLNYVFEPAPPKPPTTSTTSAPIYKRPQQPYTDFKTTKISPTIPTLNPYQTVGPKIQEASTTAPTVIVPRLKTAQPYKEKPKIIPTEAPIPVSSAATERNTNIVIKPDSQKILQQLIEAHQQQLQTPKPTRQSNTEFDLEKHLQALQKDNLLSNLPPGGAFITSDQLSSLSNFQFLQDNNDSSPLFLGNGQKVKIIQVPNKPTDKKISPEIKTLVINRPQPPTTTVKPPKVVFDELTKSVLPPGANFEVIRQKSDGRLEEVGKIPQDLQKKVTFVILEEQPDGTVKVQGVRGNENDPKDEKNKEVEVDSIIKKIQEGEIKLPPSTKLSASSSHASETKDSNSTPQESIRSPSFIKHQQNKVKIRPTPDVKVTNNGEPGPSYFPSSTGSYSNTFQGSSAKTETGTATPSSIITKQYMRPSPTSLKPSGTVTETTPYPNAHARPVFAVSNEGDQYSTQTPSPPQNRPIWPSNVGINKSPPAFLPTPTTDYDYDLSLSTNSVTHSPKPPVTRPHPIDRFRPQIKYNHVSTTPAPTSTSTTTTATFLNDNDDIQGSLNDILKKQGLFAMARFLRQSGLDTILNETGPYTVFVPTDRAFRTLQVQLGGPDKAEEKFQENPRLLSGLLLHHVVPGGFTTESLQDEMTGVSLAGTQLRVNSYTTQDIEWNDVKVLTINGAKVVPDKRNIIIPQGIAHSVDRVMFPLPVGDLYQTLRSDRDSRFNHFLKAITDSGLTSMLTGSKTYTVFAPVDAAFTSEQLDRIQSKEAAKRFVLRHLTPGTLYSAGMRYYQLRNSMENSTHLTLYKESGHLKVNSAHVLTRNIPATNGVIHAIDALL
ncbi:uncharacterized protein LOC142319932 [Lycorma delicatula]|uniref:uncharacterized protein LOC142319932 n=1 Tax=Lycorma delicatula TaxID=130591 RepID=UPI003F518A11